MDLVTEFLGLQLDAAGAVLSRVGVPLLSLGVGTFLLLVILTIGWFGLSHGLRREERARTFLGLIEIGLRQGRTPEQTVLDLARLGARDLGRGLALLADHVAVGMRLGPALDAVPSFLPAQCRALYRAAEATGDLRRALPACRAILRDGPSASLVATNNLMTILFLSPVGPILVGACSIWILPKLKAVMADMLPEGSFASMRYFDWSAHLAWATMLIWLGYWMLVCLQYGGPWLRRRLEPFLDGARDRLMFLLPWRRRRMHRDFSLMLGLALDCGVPEPGALAVAAQATGNARFIRSASRASEELGRGARLTDAVATLDSSGEFLWRLRNAAAGRGGFAAALAGWQESLAARAFQQEQAWSQLLTTVAVFINAATVALLGLGLFGMFVEIISAIE